MWHVDVISTELVMVQLVIVVVEIATFLVVKIDNFLRLKKKGDVFIVTEVDLWSTASLCGQLRNCSFCIYVFIYFIDVVASG